MEQITVQVKEALSMIPLSSTANVSHFPVERRAWRRYMPRPENCFVLLTAAGESMCPGKIHDISACGIALILNKRYDEGTLIAVDFRNASATLPSTLLMRVVRLVHREDGSYLVAGGFTSSIAENELEALVS